MPDRELPAGWQEGRLGDLVLLNPDAWEPSQNGTIRYLDIASISGPGRIGPLTEIPSAKAPSRARRKARPGDVLVGTVRPYLKAFACLSDVPDNLVISTGFAVLRPREAGDSEYVYQEVLTEEFQRHLAPRMTGTGYPAVRPKDVADFPILVPPPEERVSIAEVLDSIDAAIEKMEAVIEATERLRSALLQELLTRGVPGWNTEWKQVPLRDVLARVIDHRGLTPKKVGGQFADTGVPVISAINIRSERVALDEEIRYVSEEIYSRWMAVELQREDVVLTSEAPLGSVAFLEEHYRFCLGQRLFALRADSSRLLPKFLYYALLSPAVQRELRARATGTTATGIRQSELLKVTISIPDIGHQQQIVDALTSIERRLNSERDYLSLARIVKRFLSAGLLSGQLRVPSAVREAPA